MSDDGKRHPSVLDDPGSRAVARVYAEAYLAAAAGSGIDTAEAVRDLQSFATDVLAASPEIETALTSGLVKQDALLALIDRAIAPRVSQVLANFLRVLVTHGRLGLLPVIAREVGVKFDEQMGRKRVKVTSSHPVDAGRLDHIRRSLDAALPFEPIVDVDVDPRLLGGLVIQVGDKVYDASLRTRLDQLRERLLNRRIEPTTNPV
jgi:F-type H+-transporting ATPase subunit delta